MAIRVGMKANTYRAIIFAKSSQTRPSKHGDLKLGQICIEQKNQPGMRAKIKKRLVRTDATYILVK